MKNKLFLIALIIPFLAASCIIRRKPGYDAPVKSLHVAGNEVRIMKQLEVSDDSLPQIYITNAKSLKELMDYSKRKYQVIFIGAHYCEGAKEIFAKLRQCNDSLGEAAFDLFPLFVNREGNSGKIYDYLLQVNYYKPVLVLDLNEYKPGLFCMELRKVTNVIKELYPSYNDKNIGTGDFLVLQNGSISFQTTMAGDIEEDLRQLQELCKSSL